MTQKLRTCQSTFNRLFRIHYTHLYRYACRITGETESSRDIVNDVFASLWNNIATLEEDRAPAYLMTAVRNRCVNHLHASLQFNQYVEDYQHNHTELYTDYTEEYERDLLVRDMLLKLPPPTRNILQMCYLHRMKYAEVAQQLHISPATVKKHVSKALRLLREQNLERA